MAHDFSLLPFPILADSDLLKFYGKLKLQVSVICLLLIGQVREYSFVTLVNNRNNQFLKLLSMIFNILSRSRPFLFPGFQFFIWGG